jgi:hypothetical protein
MQAGAKTEDQQIVDDPVHTQGVIPQDRFFLKAKPFEQA